MHVLSSRGSSWTGLARQKCLSGLRSESVRLFYKLWPINLCACDHGLACNSFHSQINLVASLVMMHKKKFFFYDCAMQRRHNVLHTHYTCYILDACRFLLSCINVSRIVSNYLETSKCQPKTMQSFQKIEAIYINWESISLTGKILSRLKNNIE